MSNILEKICKDKLAAVELRKEKVSLDSIKDALKETPPTVSFLKALKAKIDREENAIIAEVKKASPSKGIICEDFKPVEIAAIYEESGAVAVSVLTEEKYFLGKAEYLSAIREKIDLPILRKDFILDIYQIYESRNIGADAILLIMAAINNDFAEEAIEIASSLDLDVLVEVHNSEELDRALKLDCKIIGINNRDLQTLSIDISNTETLYKKVPEDKIIICESGISSLEDIKRFNKLGIYAFLIGEYFMKQDDIAEAVNEFVKG